MSEELAVKTVRKWEAFMNTQRPYDFRKKLNPLWKYLLTQRRLATPITNDADHDARRTQWTSIIAPPTSCEYLSFSKHLLHQFWLTTLTTWLITYPYIAAFFWQAITVIYGFVTMIVVRNTFAATAFALIFVCACFSVLPESRKLRRKRK